LVEILGTTSKTYTDNSGRWFLNLPTGNYGNGIRYSANLFESKTAFETISVIENGEYQAGAEVLAQQGKQLSLDLSAVGGSCSSLQVALAGTSGAANVYTALFTVEGGTLEQDLVFGDYTLTASCTDAGFETVVTTLKVSAGNGLITTLEPIALRVSFVAINQGALYTNDANVTLDIGAVGASEMQVTQGSFASGWITLAETYALALDAGDGTKTVLIHLRDDAQQPLSDVSASIELDTTITVASFTATGASTKNETLHLKLDLSGETGAVVTATIPGLVNGLVLFDNGLNGDVSVNDGIYERNLDITTPNEITATVTATITDRAGNSTTQDAATGIILSTNPSISAVSVSSNVASGEMTIRFSTDEPATSSINYGIDAATLDTNLPVEALLTQNHTITLTNLPPSQLTFFELLATDNASNVGSFDGQGKLAPAPIAGLNAAAGSAEVGLVWEDSTHNELAGYNVYRSSDGGSSFNLLNTGAVTSERYLVDGNAINETSYQYYVTVVDVDGNESIASAGVVVTPSLNLLGPTQVNGGVIATDTIWLASRSPYMISNNMLIREEGGLLLMAGTKMQFEGAAKHILVKGYIQAYGSVDNVVRVLTDPNLTGAENLSSIIYDAVSNKSFWSYVHWDFVRSLTEGVAMPEDVDIRFDHALINIINGRDYSNNIYDTWRYIASINNSQIKFHDCEAVLNSIKKISNSSIKLATDNNTCTTPAGENLYAPNRLNGIENLSSVTVENVYLDAGQGIITDSSLNKVTLYGRAVNGSQFHESTITGSSSLLEMHGNIFDSATRIEATKLDVSRNYWGTTDLVVIGQQTGYIPDPASNTHLYPIVTSNDLENADWDNDGIPDIRDHDNDNDGYSDLQEDWASDPAYGSIYNPLDANSHPSEAIDTDMDGTADVIDTDDDNDNLSDTEEAAYGTNPLLADTDNDGSLDGDEVSRKYDPLDAANYPYLTSVSDITIDASNANSEGWVYFSGSALNLNSVSVMPGVKLMIDKDTQLRFSDSILLGNANSPIFMRTNGAGSGSVYLYSSQASYLNAKLNVTLNLDSNSLISHSDLALHVGGSVEGTVRDSFIKLTSGYFGINAAMSGRAQIHHSYIWGESFVYMNAGDMTDSRVVNTGAYVYDGATIDGSALDYSYGYEGVFTNSILLNAQGSGRYEQSDVRLAAIESNSFFDKSYISNVANNLFYDGLGAPTDTIGDGLGNTVFTLGSSFKVDGIKDPRSTLNFPNGESDLWNPDGVGALWDKNDPNTFPDPLAL